MPVRVVDASAVGALVFGEPRAKAIAEATAEAHLAAPTLLWFEVASVALKKVRAYPRLETQILEALRLARRLPIQLMDVDHAEVLNLARAKGLTTYDASYLWLASRLEGELITLDKKLQKASLR